jgi:mannose-6-phosphate isomerase-like protein (cupin superfamily)
MKLQTKSFLAGWVLLASAIMILAFHAQTGSAQSEPKGVARLYHLSMVRGPLRPVDQSPLGKDVSSEILAGPANGLDSGFVIYTRMPAGSHGPAMYTLPADHTYLVISGQMNVQLGTDKFVAGPDTLVLVHAGVPHEAWNAGTAPVTALEVVTPAPERDLMAMMKPAEPRKIDNAASFIRHAMPIGNTGKGTNSQPLAARATDSGDSHLQERIDNANPGFGVGPGLHVHPFNQVYFVLAGTMTLQYGVDTYQVPPLTLAVIQTGVVHYNKNTGTVPERHITLLLPEPEKEPFDLPVEFKAAPVRPAQ